MSLEAENDITAENEITAEICAPDLKVTNESNERITTVPQVEEKSLRKKLLFNDSITVVNISNEEIVNEEQEEKNSINSTLSWDDPTTAVYMSGEDMMIEPRVVEEYVVIESNAAEVASINSVSSVDNLMNELRSVKRRTKFQKHEDIADEYELQKSLKCMRTLPRSLSTKLKTKNRLQKLNRKRAIGFNKLKIKQSQTFGKAKGRFNESVSGIKLWNSTFKAIEDKFGSAVASYFKFLKWLFFINVFIFFLILIIIILPHTFVEPKSFNETIAYDQGFNESQFTESYSNAENCSKQYEDYVRNSTSSDWQYNIIDLLQGTGWMENTVLFQGYYFNKTHYFQDNHQHYNIPAAFLLVTAGYFVVTVFIMVRRSTMSIKHGIVSGESVSEISELIFCGWEFTMCSKETAKLRHKNLYNEFKASVELVKKKIDNELKDFAARCNLIIIRAAVGLVMLVFLVGSLLIIGYMTTAWMPELLTRSTVVNSPILTLIVQFLPSLTISLLNIIVPIIFEQLVNIMKVLPDNEVKIMIISTVLLRLASVFVLIITIYVTITQCPAKNCGNCKPKVQCWETYTGQQFYKLVILDFILVILITVLVEFPRMLIVRFFENKFKLIKWIGYQEFDLPANVLLIVYSQTISWVGGFFCPLLAGITAIKFLIFFYIKKWSLHFCKPATKTYRTSKIDAFFMRILLVFFAILVFLPLTFAIGRISPSQGCGPFRVYTSSSFVMFTVIQDGIALLPQVLGTILRFLGSWLFFIPAWIFLIIVINFFIAKAAAEKRMIDVLRRQCYEGSRDIKFKSKVKRAKPQVHHNNSSSF